MTNGRFFSVDEFIIANFFKINFVRNMDVREDAKLITNHIFDVILSVFACESRPQVLKCTANPGGLHGKLHQDGHLSFFTKRVFLADDVTSYFPLCCSQLLERVKGLFSVAI